MYFPDTFLVRNWKRPKVFASNLGHTWLHKQYVGSLGSIGNSGVGESWFLDLPLSKQN